MIEKIAKLILAFQGGRRRYRDNYKPWKRKKWKQGKRDWHPWHDADLHPPPGYDPYGGRSVYDRPRGLKGLIVEALLRRLSRHR